MHKIFLYILLVALTLGFVPVSASAELLPDSSVSVNVVPANPAPGNEVTITLKSFATDLDQASMSWYVNGALTQRGKALETLTLTAGAAGTTQEIEIAIETKTGSTITKKFSLSPALVELVIQSKTYTPPFYRGKALPGPESEVTIIALPTLVGSSGKIPASSLIFTWRKGNTVLGSLSGLGKNTLKVSAPRLPGDATSYSVDVSAPDANMRASGFIIVRAANPVVLLYEDNPLLGVEMNRALRDTYALSSSELTIIGYPFSFGENIYDTTYNWAINGKSVEATGAFPNTLTVRRPESGSGSSLVSLSTIGKAVFSQASRSFRVQFGSDTPTF